MKKYMRNAKIICKHRTRTVFVLLILTLSTAIEARDIHFVLTRLMDIELHFLATGNLKEGQSELNKLGTDIEKIDDRGIRTSSIAHQQLLLGYMNYMNAKKLGTDGNDAADFFEQAIFAAEAAMQEGLPAQVHSEMLRVQSDAWMQLIPLKPLSFTILNVDKFRDLPLAAIKIHKGNQRAQISRSLFLLNTPKIVGGNRREAGQILTHIAQNSKGTIRFHALVWLGKVKEELGDAESAKAHWSEAVKIIPGADWVLDIIAGSARENPLHKASRLQEVDKIGSVDKEKG